MGLRRVIFRVFWGTEHLFRNNPPFFIFIILLYSTTFLIILPIVCWQLPFSCYMSVGLGDKMTSDWIMNQNALNFVAGKTYLRKVPWKESLEMYSNYSKLESVDIAIGIVTVKRMYGTEQLGYLSQVMTKFDKLFKADKSFDSKMLFMCDVHAGPGKHFEAIRLGNHFHRVQRFINESASDVIKDPFQKEKEDYVYCIEKALEHRPKYVVIVEDDAVPHQDVFKVIKHQLHKMHSKDLERLSYLKLYYPEKWLGYSWSFTHLTELLGLGLGGGILFICFSSLNCGVPLRRSCKMVKFIVFMLGALYVILIALIVGRQHIQDLRRLSETFYRLSEAPDCCSPAILYPAKSAKRIASHLQNVVCNSDFPLDLAIDAYVKETELNRYLVEPNLFKHVGIVSTTKGIAQDLRDFLYATLNK